MAFIVDASMAAAWILADEMNPATDLVLQQLLVTSAYVPSLFWYEARNILLVAERRGRIAPDEATLAMGRLRRLPIEDGGTEHDGAILALASKHGLSAYDATYLSVAFMRRLPLATLDRKLAEAARIEKVPLLGPLAGA